MTLLARLREGAGRVRVEVETSPPPLPTSPPPVFRRPSRDTQPHTRDVHTRLVRADLRSGWLEVDLNVIRQWYYVQGESPTRIVDTVRQAVGSGPIAQAVQWHGILESFQQGASWYRIPVLLNLATFQPAEIQSAVREVVDSLDAVRRLRLDQIRRDGYDVLARLPGMMSVWHEGRGPCRERCVLEFFGAAYRYRLAEWVIWEDEGVYWVDGVSNDTRFTARVDEWELTQITVDIRGIILRVRRDHAFFEEPRYA